MVIAAVGLEPRQKSANSPNRDGKKLTGAGYFGVSKPKSPTNTAPTAWLNTAEESTVSRRCTKQFVMLGERPLYRFDNSAKLINPAPYRRPHLRPLELRF